ncbi:MAG: chemotaxis protein CheW [Deltaproteobacteria bacterium]|nr:chemotaxis protein CheW [Deltaproteobacteria bacterium]
MTLEGLSAEVLAELRRRAERVSGLAETSHQEEASLPVALFRSGGEHYAVPLATLRAALPVRLVTPIPLAPAHIVGALRFRERIISAVSLGSLLGVRGLQQDPAVLLVVQLSPQRLVAVDCEQVPTPAALPLRLVEEARARATGPIAQLTTDTLERVLLLDLPALLDGHTPGEAHGR